MDNQMAQKLRTLLSDDLDGSDAETTIRFGLDSSQYEIDLNAVHAKELRESLAPYVERARRVPGTAPRAAQGRRGAAAEADSTEIRAWARENGIGVKDRGRVSRDIVARYQAATAKQAARAI
jgi:hypothetical protein